jgi:hypothetical protein
MMLRQLVAPRVTWAALCFAATAESPPAQPAAAECCEHAALARRVAALEAAAVAVVATAATLLLLARGPADDWCAAQNGALTAGLPAFPGAPSMQPLPLVALLALPPASPRHSDAWEPPRGRLAALDAWAAGSRQLAEELLEHDVPVLWRADPGLAALVEAWPRWLRGIVNPAAGEAEAAAAEAAATTGVLTRLAPPFGSAGAGRGWRLQFFKSSSGEDGAGGTEQAARPLSPYRNGSLAELLALRAAGREAGVFGPGDGPPPYYFDGALGAAVGRVPAEAFRALPAGLDEGLLSLSLSNLVYMENPYSYKKC